MSYTPPNGNNVEFELAAYSIPAGDALVFDFSDGNAASLALAIKKQTISAAGVFVLHQYNGGVKHALYAADMSSAAFTMSLTEDTSYPLVNFHTNLASMLWKSSASTNAQTLNIDLGSAKACDFIGIGSHNLSGMISVKLQCATTDDGNFTDPLTIANLHGSLLNIISFELRTKRYWRILFKSCNSITPQLGLLYIGKSMVFPFPSQMDAELGNKQFSTTVKIAPNGTIRTARQIAGRQRMEETFTKIDDATAIAWLALMDKVQGKLKPFFFKDTKNQLHLVHFEEDYVPVKGKRANVNDLARLKMCHQTTG